MARTPVNPRKEDPETIAGYQTLIGKKVIKKSRKPFLSRQIINTVKSADIIHPVTGLTCFTFTDDESYVECHRCVEAPQL